MGCPVLIEATENCIDDSLHAFDIAEHHHGPHAEAHLDETALDVAGRAQFPPHVRRVDEEVQQLRQVPTGPLISKRPMVKGLDRLTQHAGQLRDGLRTDRLACKHATTRPTRRVEIVARTPGGSVRPLPASAAPTAPIQPLASGVDSFTGDLLLARQT